MLAAASGCELDCQRGPDWLLVRVHDLGPAEADVSELAEQVWALLEQHFTYRLVLELDAVPTVTRGLIGQLMELYRRVERHDGLMRLCGLSPENCKLLRASGLEGRLVLYRDREEAIWGCPHRPVRNARERAER